MSSKRISVIVPVYNVEEYVSTCIESLLSQTYENIEIILINDGSQDRSGEICESYAARHSTVRVIHQENSGVSAARNRGISEASGEYIGFVDADDYVSSDMYEYLMALSDKYQADVAQCKYIRTAVNDSAPVQRATFTESITVLNRKEALFELLCSQRVRNGMWSKLYKKSLFDGLSLDTRLSSGEDGLFNYHVISRAKRVVLGNAPCYFYYQREGSCTTGELSENSFRALEIIEKTAEKETDPQLQKCWKFQMALIAINYLRRAIVAADYRHFEALRRYVVDARFALLRPKKYYELHDRHIHVHILLLWIMPSLYKKIILRNSSKI